MKTALPEKVRPFLFHGVDLAIEDQESQGDCPFCDKESHLYVNTKTGQWSCKSCVEGGNIITFLSKLYEISLQTTKGKDYNELSRARKIPAAGLKRWGLARSIVTGEWLIPAYNIHGKFSNLYKTSEENQWRVFSSPGMKMHPFGTNLLKKESKLRWVCEGPWDGIITDHALQSEGKIQDVLAVPGAGTFQSDWLKYLDDQNCVLVYDNDYPRRNLKTKKVTKPGWDGMKRVIKMFSENGRKPKSLKRIRWGQSGYTKDLPDGYDMKDLFNEYGPADAFEVLGKRLERVKMSKPVKAGDDSSESLIPIERHSFAELCTDYHQSLHFTKQLQDTLTVMLACVLSTELRGDQLWIRVLGPPGSGKSTLAEAISACKDHIFPVSNITGIHSGYIGGKEGRKKDASIIPQMDRKTTIIKDGDTLLTAPSRDKILAEMRDIYDGTSRTHYRNRVSRDYDDIRTTFIICGTDEMRLLNRSFLGERFLDVEILGDEDTTPYLDRALANAYEEVSGGLLADEEADEARSEDRMVHLKRCTMGYIIHLKEELIKTKPPTMSKAVAKRIKALGQLLGNIRAKVRREGHDLAYRPRVELATRLVGQITKLCICTAIILERKRIDEDVMAIAQKVVLDTGKSFQLEIIQLLMENPGGLSAKQLEIELRISEGNIRKLTRDMLEFGIVRRRSEPNRSGQRGRNRHVWTLTKEIQKLYKEAIK